MIVLWQILFLLLGTTWFLAPHLNSLLSYRTSLISQYEAPGQAFAWLFRGGDFIAGALLLYMAIKFLARGFRVPGWMLLAISIGLMADPLFHTTCRMTGDTCQEYFSVWYLLHAIETVFTSLTFFVLAAYDSWNRKKVVSIVFAVLQVLYGALFISQLADKQSFNTASQYLYQATLIVWLAWFCRDKLAEKSFATNDTEQKLAKNTMAAWAFFNGFLAILISLAHLNLLGRVRGIYFSGDTAWLAQHGILVGIVMLYLARHLARGEARARQIFLLLCGLETIKYSLITPHLGLLMFYLLTFVVLFVLRDDFDRGTIPMTWSLRFRDLYYLVGGLLFTAFISLLILDRDNRVSLITARAFSHLTDYTFHNQPVMHRHIESILLANSITVFIIASMMAVLWVLFRPYKMPASGPASANKPSESLAKYSNSTEDFFKTWPADKRYYWNKSGSGFVAYKIIGPTVFALADPIGPQRGPLLEEFVVWCRRRRLNCCFLPVYEKSLSSYEAAGLNSLQIGSSAVIDIKNFLEETARNKWWRWRLNKTNKTGVQYQVSAAPHPAKLLEQFKKVSDTWLGLGGHEERGFALGYFDKQYINQCTVHYLVDDQGTVVAFCNQLPQFKKLGTMTIDMLRYEPQTDAMAFLLFKTIEHAQTEYEYFDLGFVPFAKASGPLLTIAKTISAGWFSARGLEQFKNKFEPDWQPNYLVYDGDLTNLAVIAINLEKAMSV